MLDALLIFDPNEITKRNLLISDVKLSHGKIIRYYHCEKTSNFISILEPVDAKDGIYELPECHNLKCLKSSIRRDDRIHRSNVWSLWRNWVGKNLEDTTELVIDG